MEQSTLEQLQKIITMSRLHRELITSNKFWVRVSCNNVFITDDVADVIESSIVDFISSSEFLPAPGSIVRGVPKNNNEDDCSRYIIKSLPQPEIKHEGEVIFNFEIEFINED